MKRWFLALTGWLFCLTLQAQSPQYTLEYWFDRDYDSHVTQTHNIAGVWQIQMEMSDLSVGFHTLNLHIKDDTGRYYSPQSFLVYRVADSASLFTADYTCWFDQDYTNRTSGSLLQNNSLLLDVASLRPGFHILNVQTSSGLGADLQSFMFYKPADEVPPQYAKNYVCWFDQDYENKSSGTLDGSPLLLNVSSLREGFHFLNVQTGEGMDASLQSFLFYRPADEVQPGNAKKYTFWFDQDYSDPFTGQLDGTPVQLDVSSLRDGFHFLNVQTGEGMDAALQSFLFYKVPVQDQEELGIEYFYWFNRDINHIQSGLLTSEDIINELIDNNNLTDEQVNKIRMMLDVSSLPDGIDTLNLLLKTDDHNTLLKIAPFQKGPVTDTFATACVTFDWYEHTHITESGEYVHTFSSDSIVTLHLTVNSTTASDTFATVCNSSFTWYDSTYTQTPETPPTHTFTNAVGCDSIVTLRLTINYSSHQAYTVEKCGSYTWENGDGKTYNQSGNYLYEHTGTNGCPQVDTLHLTIYPVPAVPTLEHEDNTSCAEPNGSITVTSPTGEGLLYSLDDGVFQGEEVFQNLTTGNYTVTVKNAHGCTAQKGVTISTIGSNLSVTASAVSPCEGGNIQLNATTQFEVEGFAWTGPNNYSSTDQNPTITDASVDMNGKYTVVVTDNLGCTAFDTVRVAVKKKTYGDTTATACGSFIWYGTTYTHTPETAPTHTFTNAAGCDSVVTLNLTVNSPSFGDTIATACGSFTWYGTTYTHTPETPPTHTFTNAVGCDSVVTLHLTVNHPSTGDTSATACGSFTWYGTTYTHTPETAPTHTFTNAAGCDSVVTLHLTIYPEVELSVTNTNQTKVFGQAIDNVVVTHSDFSQLTHSTLPDGLSYNSSTGILSGTPTATGDYTVTFTATSTLIPSCGTEQQEVVNITVNPKPVTITAKSANKKYDGTALTESDFTASALETGDTHTFLVAMTSSSTITHYGMQPNVIATVDGEQINTNDGTVVGNYLITTVDGTLSISKRIVHIQTAADEKLYDATPLSNANYTITGDGFVTGEVTDIHTSGSVTDMNTCVNNEIVYTPTSTFNASNYQIDTVIGKLCISGNMAAITVTSAGAPAPIVYDGQPHGSEYQHYTVTFDGQAVSPDETGKVFNLPTGDVLTVTPTFAGVTNVADINDTANNNVFTYSITHNEGYIGPRTITYGTVNLKKRPVTITASSEYSSKTYDGTPLKVTYEHLTATGLVEGESLSAGYVETDDIAPGEYLCNDNSFQYVMALTASQHGIQVSSENTNYTPTFNVKLTILPINFDCPETKTFTLIEGTREMNVPESELGVPTMDDEPLPSYLTASSNIANLNPLPAGEHTVTWSFFDGDGIQVSTCSQTVMVQYEPCDSIITYQGYDYRYKRVGFQCWFTENLRVPVGDYHAYDDNMANVEKFGYLYSWNTAVGVSDDNVNAVPETYTADDGTLYVQGICPEGWAVPSTLDVSNLNSAVGSTTLLKDPSNAYWLPNFQGTPNGTGFNARGGGFYNAAQNRYEDLLTGFHFWESDAVQSSGSMISAYLVYYCDSVFINHPSQKNDKKSVRCIRKSAL